MNQSPQSTLGWAHVALLLPAVSRDSVVVTWAPCCPSQPPLLRHGALEGVHSLSGPSVAPDMHTSAFYSAQIPCSLVAVSWRSVDVHLKWVTLMISRIQRTSLPSVRVLY